MCCLQWGISHPYLVFILIKFENEKQQLWSGIPLTSQLYTKPYLRFLFKVFRNYQVFVIPNFGGRAKISRKSGICVWYSLHASCYPLFINPYSIVSKYLKLVIAGPLLQKLILHVINFGRALQKQERSSLTLAQVDFCLCRRYTVQCWGFEK